MTTTIELGKSEKVVKELKPIEFCCRLNRHDFIKNKNLDAFCNAKDSAYNPEKFSYIELVAREYIVGYDLMFAYNHPDDRGHSCLLFLGHWNDGVV
jgi:hypothetical protein